MVASERESSERLRPAIAGVVMGLALFAVAFGGPVVKVIAVVMALALLQGLWRGALELGGIVAGLIVAVLLAPLLGRSVEGLVSSATGVSGLMSRWLALGLVAVGIVAICGIGSRLIARRIIDRHPQWRRFDRYAGAAVGLVQGAILSLLLLWGLLALEPVARAQLTAWFEDGGQDGQPQQYAPPPPNPMARTIAGWADQVHQSSLGGIARRTNPVESSELLALAADFALVSRHREALVYLLESPVLQKIEALPSYQEAIATLRQDPQLVPLLEGGEVSLDTVRAVLNSPSVLELFDRTTIVRDMGPLVPELTQVLREAKAIAAGEGPPRR